jgi:hypothetical protein
MLFNGIIAVCCGKDMKYVNKLCGRKAELLIVNACGTYTYHWALKG